MRLFIGIEIPDNTKDYLISIGKIISLHSGHYKFLNKEQIHITLKFLGEVPPNKLNNIIESLEKIKFNHFSVSLTKIGFFQNENHIRVIWVGLEPEKELNELQKQIDNSLKQLFNKEKAFKAHLTLARVKNIENKKTFFEGIRKLNIKNEKIYVNNFKLIKSTLTPKGPVYEDLKIFMCSE